MSTAPSTKEETPPHRVTVAGLEGTVEVLVDPWGVAHIYAGSAADAFFGQGFNIARERLFQLEMWRRSGLGLISEVMGPAYLAQDRARRLMMYRGDLTVERDSYTEFTLAALTSFVEGINTFVHLVRAGDAPLPAEFEALDSLPSLWDVDDVLIIRSPGIYHNFEQEVTRWQTTARHGAQIEQLRRATDPPGATLPAEELLAADGPPEGLLEAYRLGVGGWKPLGLDCGAEGGGSNNWAITGTRTATGRPILANDPHRPLTTPSGRYIVHIACPEFDVIGGGEPFLPGVSIGHNGTIGFGLTILPADQEDLVVGELDPNSDDGCLAHGQWLDVTTVREDIPVRGGQPVPVDLRFTAEGPVIFEEAAPRRVHILRAVWLEAGMVPYIGSLEYMRAHSWRSFTDAMVHCGGPPENYVYADVAGDIGWVAGGRLPVRLGWDGSSPVPPHRPNVWAGRFSAHEVGAELNPDRGWVATANECNFADTPAVEGRTITRDWYAPSRYQRIADVLESRTGLTVDDCVRLQNDYTSLPAAQILERTVHRISSEHDAIGLQLLRDWDATLDEESAAATLYEIWYREHFRPALLRAVLDRRVPPEDVDAALRAVLPNEEAVADSRVDLQILQEPERFLGAGAPETIQQITLRTLRSAVEELVARHGSDPAGWTWGSVHFARFDHPLRGLVAQADDWGPIGPFPRGGNGDTVAQTAYTSEYRQNNGATFRLVIDVGDWDNSRAMNAPGQSGRPDSPHYADLAELWREDAAFPLLYTRPAVERAAVESYLLRGPGPTPSSLTPNE